MSILDSLSEFSDSQAIRTTGDIVCDQPILRRTGDIGVGEPMWLSLWATEGFAGKGRLQFVLQTDDAADFGTAQDALSLGPVDFSALKAGFTTATRLPVGLQANLRVLYRVEADTAPTQGALSAALVLDIQCNKPYRSGWHIHDLNEPRHPTGDAPRKDAPPAKEGEPETPNLPPEKEQPPKKEPEQPPEDKPPPKQKEPPKQAPEDGKQPKLPPYDPDKPHKPPRSGPGPFKEEQQG